MSESDNGSHGHGSGGDSPSDSENEDGAEKPKAMLELPDVVFRLVCRFLE